MLSYSRFKSLYREQTRQSKIRFAWPKNVAVHVLQRLCVIAKISVMLRWMKKLTYSLGIYISFSTVVLLLLSTQWKSLMLKRSTKSRMANVNEYSPGNMVYHSQQCGMTVRSGLQMALWCCARCPRLSLGSRGISLRGVGWIRLIVGFQPLMVISPTASWIRWCMQV